MSIGRSLHFTRNFLLRPGEIGAIAPSSNALSREMVADIAPQDAGTVLEFGPGTGSLTKMVADLAGSPERYLGIEINPNFVRVLHDRFKDLPIVEGSAEDAERICVEYGVTSIRAIISGLPFACLPRTIQDNVIDAVERLLPVGAEFRTFQYVHSYGLPAAIRFRKLMADRFGAMHRRGPVFRNLPPAYVLCWTKQAASTPQPH